MSIGFLLFLIALLSSLIGLYGMFQKAGIAGWKAFIPFYNTWCMVDKMKLKIPILGDIQRKSAVSRFSRTLGTLVTSGVPILQALNITRDTAGNVVISCAIEKVYEVVKEGETIVIPF